MPRIDTRELGGWDQDVAGLAGALVHEIKNPLSTLNISAQLLLEEWSQPATPREVRMVKRLEVIRSEIGRIEHITNSFLSFVRHQMTETTPVDLNSLLSDLIAHNREGLERAGIQVRCQLEEGLATVDGDENLLRQAFLNLLRNAEQAMSGGGELIVRTRSGNGAAVEVEVIDTGPGIAEERLAKVFRPYFSSKPGGTGLGLPTTLRLIRMHRGNLVLESEVGKGCRFLVSLPPTGARVGAPAS
ncbi:MAG: two-component system sensor histidine kinase NtrB [Planctomycetota bacterium]